VHIRARSEDYFNFQGSVVHSEYVHGDQIVNRSLHIWEFFDVWEVKFRGKNQACGQIVGTSP
jgi:hypothetical protein